MVKTLHAYSFTRYTDESAPHLAVRGFRPRDRVSAPPVSLAYAGLQHTASAELPGEWKRWKRIFVGNQSHVAFLASSINLSFSKRV